MIELLSCLLVAQAAEVSSRDGGHVQNPQWSDDGSYLAYEVNDLSDTVELFVVEVVSGSARTPRELEVPGTGGGFAGGGFAAAPHWADKPQQMVIYEGSNAGGTVRLYYANPAGGAPNEILTSNQIGGNLGFPSMAADGSKLAFVSDSAGRGDIFIWELSNNAVTSIFPTDAPEHFPTFGDGASDRLVFTRKNGGTEDLFSWNGSTTPPLKGGNGDQTRPTLVGEKVVYFTSERGDGHWDIAVTSSEPGGKRSIIARDVKLPSRGTPAVTPDGRSVAWVSADPSQSHQVSFTRLDGSSTSTLDTGLVSAGEPAVTTASGKVWLAFTALPSAGSDWRKLHVVDVTGSF